MFRIFLFLKHFLINFQSTQYSVLERWLNFQQHWHFGCLETLDIIFDIFWEAGSGLESFVEKYDGNEEEYVDHGNRQADIWHLKTNICLN